MEQPTGQYPWHCDYNRGVPPQWNVMHGQSRHQFFPQPPPPPPSVKGRIMENPYDNTSLMGSPLFLPSEVSENNFNQTWDMDGYTTYNDGSCLSIVNANDDESWESHDTSLCSSTASNKPLGISPFETGLSHWQQKTVDLWTPVDAVNWVLNVAHEHHLDCEDIHKFQNMDGHKLINMTEAGFISLEPNCGRTLYREMLNLKSEQALNHLDSYDISGDELIPYQIERTEFRNTTTEHTICSQDRTEDCEQIQPKIKRSPGRPRIPGRRNKKQEKKTGRLWEFIRDLLLKPEYCPSLICWEDHDQGIFRFVHSEKVANLWGTLKENPKMTYEKLSRAMRYYYRSKVLQPVLGRRLVYKFGPTATGWRTLNPNFKNNDSPKCKH